MRHVLLLGAITAGTHRMGQATAAARLVASAGGALAMATGLPRAAPRTIDLAAVAAAADQHLSLAADTQEQPAGRLGSLRLVRTWTTSVMGGILPPHTCSARCGARRRSQTSRFRSAPCLPCQSDRSSPHHCAPRGRHPKPPIDRARRPVDMWTTQGALPTDPQAQQAAASINSIVQEEQVQTCRNIALRHLCADPDRHSQGVTREGTGGGASLALLDERHLA